MTFSATSVINMTTLPHIENGRHVITEEARALTQLAQSLDNEFEQAIELIAKTKGRFIVSGLGKSGHVGRKIAATFASTGQPSYFVHASEANHGDLGMITKDDTLLLISYSGEAQELTAVIDYAHRFSIPIVCITGKKSSTLARLSNVALILPDVQEACPNGLAPTTSSTLTLALGDALAVALLKSRGFSKNDFKIFHPGGNLGQQLRKVSDFMHTGPKVPLAYFSEKMSTCLLSMTSGGFGILGIIDDSQKLIGVITDGDLRRHMSPDLLEKNAQQVMTCNPVTMREFHLMSDALALFEERSITSVFIVDVNQKVIGIIHIHDCLRRSAA
jgi:arabinose-5-phosphate isomerase